jgi:N-acetylneuraminate synthase
MANLAEIEEAYRTAVVGGADGVALLHCVSGYPTPMAECNLRTIGDLSRRFPEAVIGLSDHTLGTVAATAAIALGASLIEKHVTMSRAAGGPDAAFSLEPHELRQLVEQCGDAWEALGVADYDLKGSEKGNVVFRRSLYVVEDVQAGEPLTSRNVRSIRPGFGLPPKHLDAVVGRRVRRAVAAGTALSWDLLE